MNFYFYQSLQPDTGKAIPVINRLSEEPPLVEIGSPYHIEAQEENTSDTMEQSPQKAEPHLPLKLFDSETDASVVLQSSTGVVAANTTTDVHPRFVFRNASNSSASTAIERRQGGGEDDGGESGDDTHEREREWEREVARHASE